MILKVKHDTTYAYEGLVTQIVQVLRLTPRHHDAQRVLEWRLTRSDGGALPSYVDGLGNVCHVSSLRGPAETLTITAQGRVQNEDSQGVVSGAPEPLPPAYYLRETPLAKPNDAITNFARERVDTRTDRASIYELTTAIHEAVAYTPGATHVRTPAAAAFAANKGVCQDQAHILIAAARALGAPARYVGGYVWPGEASVEPHDFASHAWAEVFTSDAGWVGFDPSNGVWATKSHLRCAWGLDYSQAAPISGLWRGAGSEDMSVAGDIQALDSAQ